MNGDGAHTCSGVLHLSMHAAEFPSRMNVVRFRADPGGRRFGFSRRKG